MFISVSEVLAFTVVLLLQNMPSLLFCSDCFLLFFHVCKELEEEIYDKVVDLTEYAKRQRWWNRLFGKNSGPVAEKYSVATQIAIGGVSGW